MKQQELLQQISKYFSRFSEQVKILNSNSEFSINIHAENVLIKILNLIYDCDFENVNYVENKNYDSIDLRDKNKKCSIQVTATNKLEKVKTTLEKYIDNEYYKEYAELKILMLTGRQKKYSQYAINKITKGKINFNESSQIADFSTLYICLNKLNDINIIEAVKDILEQQFSDNVKSFLHYNINTFNELCSIILPLLQKNERAFSNYGPNSSANVSVALRWDMALWYKSRTDIILPNNKIVAELLEINMILVPTEKREVIEQYLAHVYAFQKHCEDTNFDYGNHRFPTKFHEIISNHANYTET